MNLIKAEDWFPADGLELEDNAFEAVKSCYNSLVVAGPGAGKTELLAQRACFLLQTNTCKYPYKILAISFKRDAAFNLKERVKARCGEEQSKRFDSFTFDAFAKQLLDRFKSALPKPFKIEGEYEVLFEEKVIVSIYENVDRAFVFARQKGDILRIHNSSLIYSLNPKEEIIRNEVWRRLLKGETPSLTFKMIMRLAELILYKNPRITQYLQTTYKYIFLDEYQDTTFLQYDFLKSCFSGCNPVYTAVGDEKQRIMVWAGANPEIFEVFKREQGARYLPLLKNYRSAPRLVALQNHLVQHLLKNEYEEVTYSGNWNEADGQSFVWAYKDYEAEAQHLLLKVRHWIEVEGVNSRDISILVKQDLKRYAGPLIKYFNENGIRIRDESLLQELLSDEVSEFVINFIYLIYDDKSREAKMSVIKFLRNIYAEIDEKQFLRLDAELGKVIRRLKKEFSAPRSKHEIGALIQEAITFANPPRVRGYYLNYRKAGELEARLLQVQSYLISYFKDGAKNIIEALDLLVGKSSIPVMTIHKSKGLEYHTVIFIGLEDDAFWTFDKQPDEDKCAFFVALSRAKERVVFTLSKVRDSKFQKDEKQKFKKTKVFFEELQKSGVVEMRAIN